MKSKNLNDVDDADLLFCINCKYIDIASRWKGRIGKILAHDISIGDRVKEKGECPICGSLAFDIFEYIEEEGETIH